MNNQNLQNHKKYKALMLDVDGTMVPNRRDGMPSERVKKAIEKARDKIHIGIVTGRSLQYLHSVFDVLKLSGPAIIENGTIIIDCETKKILWEKPIQKEDVMHVIKVLEPFRKKVWVKDSDITMEFPLTKQYKPQKPYVLFNLGFTLEEANRLENELSHIPSVTIHKMLSWTDNKIDISITHAEATKQHGILEAAKILGINTHEIIGVGDAYNDFPLLMACGFKVAMGNAVKELKEIADYIAPSVEEDGVADVIEKFVL